MFAIFQEKGKKRGESKIYENLGKSWKFENILKKGRWLYAIIAHNKLLEKALIYCAAIIAGFSRLLSRAQANIF